MADENDEMYSDGPDAAPAATETDEANKDGPGSTNEGGTALVPTEFFEGKTPDVGTVCRVKVEKIYDGEVRLAYQKHKETESPSEDANPNDEMESMMSDA